jgi:pimeloyl-ACP methyl ester carboxylesterase
MVADASWSRLPGWQLRLIAGLFPVGLTPGSSVSIQVLVEVLVSVELSFNEYGAGPPVVILHGLFGSKRNWSSIARQLAPDFHVYAVDLRNHGESPWHEQHDYPAMAADVADLIEQQVGQPVTLIGHSMGGKVAMYLALTRPELVERLVVVDIPPARSRGTPISYVHAMQAVPLAQFSRRSEVEQALAETIADPVVRGFLVTNIISGPEGLAWTVNLDAIERQFDTILDWPATAAGRQFSGQTLFIRGNRSAFIKPEHEAIIRQLFPAAMTESVIGAGHWVHAEQPAAFLELVQRFLAG